MSYKHITFLLALILTHSCQKKHDLIRIEANRIAISDSLSSNEDIENYIQPYRERLQNDLDSILSYAVDNYSKSDGEFNTAIGNFMADAVYTEVNPIFKSRSGKNIDLVLLNHGGIRSSISKGNITTRTAFEVMPFENSVYVVALKGRQILALVDYLAKAKRAHPIQGLKLVLDNEFNVISATVHGLPIDVTKTYYVATNDYLYNGGDGMTFFKENDTLFDLNYKIRNVLIDHFKKKDTIRPTIDDRFIKL